MCQRTPYHHGKKNKEEIFQTNKSEFGVKKVKPEKYETLNKAVKKWLLILRSENVLVSGPMLNEKALKFANELSIEGFHASEWWLEKWKKRYVKNFFHRQINTLQQYAKFFL